MKLYVDELFPTKVFVVDELLEKKDIDLMKKDIIKSVKKTPQDNWQSHPRLQYEKLYEPLLNEIKSVFEKYVFDMRWEIKQYQITDMWSNVLKPNEMHRPHTHSNNVVSGVYYVKTKKGNNKSAESSAIQFYDPRPQTNILVPKMTENNISNSSIWFYPAVTNRLLMFPSWLEHYVPINITNENRISISWNIMFKGKIGDSEQYQSAVF